MPENNENTAMANSTSGKGRWSFLEGEMVFKKESASGTTQRDVMGREEGGGFRMGNTGIPVADSF